MNYAAQGGDDSKMSVRCAVIVLHVMLPVVLTRFSLVMVFFMFLPPPFVQARSNPHPIDGIPLLVFPKALPFAGPSLAASFL